MPITIAHIHRFPVKGCGVRRSRRLSCPQGKARRTIAASRSHAATRGSLAPRRRSRAGHWLRFFGFLTRSAPIVLRRR
jgi:hypothetical protein